MDGEELLGLWSYSWINASGQLPRTHWHLLGFLTEILQPKRPASGTAFRPQASALPR